ncbi:MAG: PAS domain-containing methyl-accepting chemotaxis protein [Pseudomonadota bacterium]
MAYFERLLSASLKRPIWSNSKADLVGALNQSHAIAEFDVHGGLITANTVFLKTFGYRRADIKGKDHASFVSADGGVSTAENDLWRSLEGGAVVSARFKRVKKNGDALWLQATYTPVIDRQGTVSKIIHVGVDVTDDERRKIENQGKIDALNRSTAVIVYDPDGTILNVNENFLNALGYAPGELEGKNHSMFVHPSYRNTDGYRRFWEELRAGDFKSAEYKRFGRDRKEIWIQGSYNPIFDVDGAVVGVVNFATNITDRMKRDIDYAAKVAAIGRSNAVIEFSPDGTILEANENFLAMMGYSSPEIVGKHHSMFEQAAYRNSPEYQAFWSALRDGAFQSGEYECRTKDGSSVWLQATYNPVKDRSGRLLKIVQFSSDITAIHEERFRNTHNLTTVIDTLGDSLQNLAAGALDVAIETPFTDDFERLRVDYNDAVEKMRATILAIRSSAKTLNESATAIGDLSTDLSRRTEKEASTVEEAVASLEHITRTVTASADGADRARQAASETKNEADIGKTVVTQAVAAMGKIEDSSAKIGAIVGVIDDVAFQTNLLALNAGVEAARAGEAGRGFAVVATEVRALAQRTTDAAKEIKALIATSVADVEGGVDLVGETGDALERIAARVSEMTKLIAVISSGANDQAQSIKALNAAVGAVDSNTQQNAKMVDTLNASTSALRHETADLVGSVSKFDAEQRQNASADASKIAAA